MTIRFVPRIGPFVFYRSRRRSGEHGLLYSMLWLTIMPMIWLFQFFYYLMKIIVIGMVLGCVALAGLVTKITNSRKVARPEGRHVL